jgi:hypothetical protein
MHSCARCKTGFDADILDKCPTCNKQVHYFFTHCPVCDCGYQPIAYLECPGCYSKRTGNLNCEAILKKPEQYNEDGYDSDGYDRDGYTWHGYNKEGYDRDGYNCYGFNKDGYNREGLHSAVGTGEEYFIDESPHSHKSEFLTDVEYCYLVSCQNNNALLCSFLRIRIGADGICMGYEPIEETGDRGAE